MIYVHFVSLEYGNQRTVREGKFDHMDQARAAVEKHIEGSGFTDLKYVRGLYDDEGGRFTATTPGGRAGRNVAYVDFGGSDE